MPLTTVNWVLLDQKNLLLPHSLSVASLCPAAVPPLLQKFNSSARAMHRGENQRRLSLIYALPPFSPLFLSADSHHGALV